MVFDGDDIGRWKWRQQKSGTWAQLMSEQRERLTALGIQAPAPAPAPAPAAALAAGGAGEGSSKAQQAFQRGLAAAARPGLRWHPGG
ncbi:hypothetical protein GCM10010275_69120 [Streptomyces litmocidini]|uniref:hypothetical protein n=1 Tax=Streptomyces litmocidini TaxID=67318 RepID=UPI00167C7CCB|nr:hypothetical protein [Streptomyces litmocidini]GGV17717.1 hypothetical protein GCM10010275_69120 [Streptomyces litmocidini]